MSINEREEEKKENKREKGIIKRTDLQRAFAPVFNGLQ